MNKSLPPQFSIQALKTQARRLRAQLGSKGQAITHSHALELLAHQYGHKNWNTLRAVAEAHPPSRTLSLGDLVRGHYLGQPFQGRVIGVQALTSPDHRRISLQFNEPVDVVTFGSFSNLRQRVSCVIDKSGRSLNKTSDGRPHLLLANVNDDAPISP